jgi:ABC-type lipoprotein release transport system permease subunit
MGVGWGLAFVVQAHLAPGSPVPGLFVSIPVMLAGVSMLACWIPARRATRFDPMVTLRED